MSTRMSAGRVRKAYQFIEAHRRDYPVQTMCQVLEVAPSGYYEWLHSPLSDRVREDARLLRLIRASFVASHGIYGAPRVFLDLREAGEICSKHRVERLMRQNGLRALHGLSNTAAVRKQTSGSASEFAQTTVYGHQAKSRLGHGYHVYPHWQGWLYLAVVIDLHSRRVVGWATR